MPSLINLASESVIQDLLNKLKFVALKALDYLNIKNKPYFFLYEELFYILNKVAAKVKFDFSLIYQHTFEIMWTNLVLQVGSKNYRLIKFINDFSQQTELIES